MLSSCDRNIQYSFNDFLFNALEATYPVYAANSKKAKQNVNITKEATSLKII